MKTLEKTFTKKGRTYTLVKREDLLDGQSLAIYEIKENLWPTPSYEVIVIQKKEACEIMGNSVPAHEAFPGNEKWGRLGWSCDTLPRAEIKFLLIKDRILEACDKKENFLKKIESNPHWQKNKDNSFSGKTLSN